MVIGFDDFGFSEKEERTRMREKVDAIYGKKRFQHSTDELMRLLRE